MTEIYNFNHNSKVYKVTQAEAEKALDNIKAEFGNDLEICYEDDVIHLTHTNWKIEDKVVDGHFWCETPTGEVYGDTTGQFHINRFKENGDLPVYLPANPEDEERFIKEKLEYTKKEIEKFDCEEEYYYELEKYMRNKSGAFDCYQNVILISYKTGYKIRYGHFGALNPKTNMIYWFFGHPTNTYDDFVRDRNAKDYKSGKTHLSSHPYLVERQKIQMEREAEKKRIEKEREDKYKKFVAEQEQKKADKAREELFKMLEEEEKKPNKNQKTKKNKSKK